MSSASRVSLFSAVAMIATACSDRTALVQQANAASNQRLIGIWDARFQLERPLFAAADSRAVNHYVSGELAFLPNRWLTRAYPMIKSASVYGSYDVDFSPFGFDARSDDETPTAVAGWLSSDSLEIVIGNSGSDVTVRMAGRIAGDSISGGWRVLISRTSGGGGRFVMVRHK